MGRHPKRIDERFFDSQTRAAWYVLGACYHGMRIIEDDAIIFKSSSKKLVEIVKEELASRHTITADTRGRSSYWFVVRARPHLVEKLDDLGLKLPKGERRFPVVTESYAGHFVRGFFDANAYFRNHGDFRLVFNFNEGFLAMLDHTLANYAGVDLPRKSSTVVEYRQEDITKVERFMYRDWKYIRRNRLYLPGKKRALSSHCLTE